MPEDPVPSVLTLSYSPKASSASCDALGAASSHTSRKPRLGNVRVRLFLRGNATAIPGGELFLRVNATAIPGGEAGVLFRAAKSLLDRCGSCGDASQRLPQLGDDAGDGRLPVGVASE